MNNASLELGGTNWAEKDGNILGYSVGDTSGKYSPQEFTFARGSNLSATRIDRAGLIVKGRENVLLQSNQFDTTWGLSVSITITSGQSGYDGTNDAWLLKRSDANARYINQNITLGSSVYTYSVYAKPESENWMYFWSYNGSGSVNAYFDLQNGLVGNTSGLIDATIVDAGNGYYRCSMTYNNNIAAVRIYPAVANGSISGGIANAGIYIQDAQIEQGLAASPYIETTTTSAQAGVLENTPRLNYTTGVANPYLLLEPSRTNLFPNSEFFGVGTGDWISYGGQSIATNSTISPEGFKNATKLTDTGGVYNQVVYNPNINYVFSLFAKTDTATSITMNFVDQGAGYLGGSIKYTFATGATSVILQSANGSVTADKEDYGNGWIRVILKFTTNAAQNYNYQQIDFQGGDGWIFGTQLETGSYPTSYIPTYSVSATRAEDNCNKTNASGEIGQTEGTIFLDFVAQTSAGQSQSHFALGSIGNEILIYGSTAFQFYSSGGVNIGGGGFVTGQRYKIAFAYKANNYVAYVNGLQKGTDGNASVPTTSAIYLNSYVDGSEIQKKKINQAALYKERLTNAELATLTTI